MQRRHLFLKGISAHAHRSPSMFVIVFRYDVWCLSTLFSNRIADMFRAVHEHTAQTLQACVHEPFTKNRSRAKCCVCVYIYIYIYILLLLLLYYNIVYVYNMYVCIYIYIYTYIHTYMTHTYIYTYIYIYMYIHIT